VDQETITGQTGLFLSLCMRLVPYGVSQSRMSSHDHGHDGEALFEVCESYTPRLWRHGSVGGLELGLTGRLAHLESCRKGAFGLERDNSRGWPSNAQRDRSQRSGLLQCLTFTEVII
jgi:hypothetical protein